MTLKDAGSAWMVGDIGDPGLQAWLRRKVKTHLFITQARIEADDLVQEMNLHLLESLSLFPSSCKTWPHFCRSQVFRKIRHAHQPRPSKTELPVREEVEAMVPIEAGKRPARAVPRPDPRLRLSRLLGSQPIAVVAKETEIPAKTLLAPIAKMKLAMQRRYPEVYGASKQDLGYRGMIRWNPPSTLPQPKPPEPVAESGVVVWLQPTQPKRASSQTEAIQTATAQAPKRPKPSAKRVKRTKRQKPPTPAKPRRNRRSARRRAAIRARQHRLERKRALRRLARPCRRNKTKTQASRASAPPRTQLPNPRSRYQRQQGPRNQPPRLSKPRNPTISRSVVGPCRGSWSACT